MKQKNIALVLVLIIVASFLIVAFNQFVPSETASIENSITGCATLPPAKCLKSIRSSEGIYTPAKMKQTDDLVAYVHNEGQRYAQTLVNKGIMTPDDMKALQEGKLSPTRAQQINANAGQIIFKTDANGVIMYPPKGLTGDPNIYYFYSDKTALPAGARAWEAVSYKFGPPKYDVPTEGSGVTTGDFEIYVAGNSKSWNSLSASEKAAYGPEYADMLNYLRENNGGIKVENLDSYIKVNPNTGQLYVEGIPRQNIQYEPGYNYMAPGATGTAGRPATSIGNAVDNGDGTITITGRVTTLKDGSIVWVEYQNPENPFEGVIVRYSDGHTADVTDLGTEEWIAGVPPAEVEKRYGLGTYDKSTREYIPTLKAEPVESGNLGEEPLDVGLDEEPVDLGEPIEELPEAEVITD